MNTELQENIESSVTSTKAVLAIICGTIIILLAGGVSSLVYKLSIPSILLPILYSVLYILITYSYRISIIFDKKKIEKASINIFVN